MTATFSPIVLFHQAAGAFLLPPLCFIWLALIGVALKRRSLILLALFFSYLLATPKMALWLTQPLEPPALSVNASLPQVDAIVVLGGGSHWAPEYASEQLDTESLVRLQYASILARRSGKPLLVTGGAPLGGEAEGLLMARALQSEYGVSVRWVELKSNTTAENAQYAAALLKPAGVKRIALVSSAWHLRRAVQDFTRQGLIVTPAPTGFVRYQGPEWALYLPKARAMQQTSTALREWLALAAY